jgi:hypothetical protein
LLSVALYFSGLCCSLLFGSLLLSIVRLSQLKVALYYRNLTAPGVWDEDGGVKYVVEGGPQRLLLKMRAAMERLGARFFLRERVTRLERHGNGGLALRTAKGLRVLAQRVVLAVPPGAFARHVKGRLGLRLARRRELKAVQRGEAASALNLYFERPFWQRRFPAQQRWGNATLGPQYTSWSLEYHQAMLQFIATPDRIKVRLLCIVFFFSSYLITGQFGAVLLCARRCQGLAAAEADRGDGGTGAPGNAAPGAPGAAAA